MVALDNDAKLNTIMTITSTSSHNLTSPQLFELTLIFTTLATLLTIMLHLWHDYTMFLALGPGGTPKTLIGWAKVTILGLFALRNPYAPAVRPPELLNISGHLGTLPPRQGHRPQTRGVAPHRQIDQKASTALYLQLATAIEDLGSSNPATLRIGTSCFEKHATGLFAAAPASKRRCGGEICHVHPSDGSMHLTLHPADAKVVLERGWAERHPLARGGWFERFVPGGFVMVYAPRDESEVEVIMRVVKAAAWFVSGTDGFEDTKDRAACHDSGYSSAGEGAQA